MQAAGCFERIGWQPLLNVRPGLLHDSIDVGKFHLAPQEGVGGDVFPIAPPRATPVGEMTELLIDKLEQAGVKCPEVVNGETRLGDVRRNFSDTRKARERLGWDVKVELDEGLANAIKYYLKS